MNLIEFLERLGKGASRMIWWVALMGAASTCGVVYLWWQSGQMVGALITALVGAVCVLPSALLAEALADVAGLRQIVKDGFQQVKRTDATTLKRTRDGVYTAVSVSWLAGSAAMLTSPLWWVLAVLGMIGCGFMTLWAVVWHLMVWL